MEPSPSPGVGVELMRVGTEARPAGRTHLRAGLSDHRLRRHFGLRVTDTSKSKQVWPTRSSIT